MTGVQTCALPIYLQVLGEDKDTQLNLTWRTLDEKKNETDVCLGCGTFQLNDKVRGLVEKLVGEKPIVVRVVRKEKGILFRDTPYTKFFRSEEHTSELQSRTNLVCRLLLEKKKIK